MTDPGSSARTMVGVLLVPVFLVAGLPSLAKDKPGDLAAEVDKAVARGVSYLKGKQGKDGAWDSDGHELGATALAVYALLKANCPLADRAVSAGIGFLLNTDIASNANNVATYDVSLAAVALACAIEKTAKAKGSPAPGIDPAACGRKLQEAVEWLVAAQHDCRAENSLRRVRRSGKRPEGEIKPAELSAGGYDLGPFRSADGAAWGYRLRDTSYVDNSNTQFALLGLRAAQNIHDDFGGTNIVVPRAVWEKALARLVARQATAGEWDYGASGLGLRGFQDTMTAAGIGGVIICLSSLIEKPDLGRITRTPEIVKALGRLERYVYPPPNTIRFEPTGGASRAPDRSGYMLYSLERACMLGGLKRLGAFQKFA